MESLTTAARLCSSPATLLGTTSSAAVQSFINNFCITIKLLPSWLFYSLQSCTNMQTLHVHLAFKAVFRMNQPLLLQQLMWCVFSKLRRWNDCEWASLQSLDHAKPQLLKRRALTPHKCSTQSTALMRLLICLHSIRQSRGIYWHIKKK